MSEQPIQRQRNADVDGTSGRYPHCGSRGPMTLPW